MKREVYVVCVTSGGPDGGWPCAVFATMKGALKECKRLAGKAKVNQEGMWERVLKGSKLKDTTTFSVEKMRDKKYPGYGVRRKCKEAKTDSVVYAKIYYVEKYVLGKKADEVWEW